MAYGIGLGELWEVLPPEGITGLPTPPYQICTVLAYRGKKLPLIRLSELFGVSADRVPSGARVLLTQGRGKPFGLLVDEVGGMAEVDPTRIARVPKLASLLNPGLFRGIFSHEGHPVLLLAEDGLASVNEVSTFYSR